MDTNTKSAGRIDGIRWLALIAVALFGLTLTIGSGGGNGDDDEGSEPSEVGILGIYEFTIGGPLAGDAGPSQIDIAFDGAFELSLQPTVTGSVVCDQVTEECGLQTVWDGSTALVEDQSDPAIVGDFTVTVTELWVLDPDDADADPSTGAIRVESLDPALADVIVEVADCDPGGPGVQVTTEPASTTACYTWEEFDSLLDELDPEESVALRAVLGWGAIDFTLEQSVYAFEIFPLLEDATFADGSPTEQCDIYGSTWTEGPPNPGTTTLSWFDDNPDGSVGPGDSFRQEFNECWLDEPNDDIDELLNGIMDFVSYTEVIDPSREVLTRIGFEGETQNMKIGGVGYGDELGNAPVVITETLDSGGTISVDSEIRLSGKYVIVFYE